MTVPEKKLASLYFAISSDLKQFPNYEQFNQDMEECFRFAGKVQNALITTAYLLSFHFKPENLPKDKTGAVKFQHEKEISSFSKIRFIVPRTEEQTDLFTALMTRQLEHSNVQAYVPGTYQRVCQALTQTFELKNKEIGLSAIAYGVLNQQEPTLKQFQNQKNGFTSLTYKSAQDRRTISLQVTNPALLKPSRFRVPHKDDNYAFYEAQFKRQTNNNKFTSKIQYLTVPSLNLAYRICFIQHRPMPIGSVVKQLSIKRIPHPSLPNKFSYELGMQVEYPTAYNYVIPSLQKERMLLGIDKSINIPYMDSEGNTFETAKLKAKLDNVTEILGNVTIQHGKKWTYSKYRAKIKHIQEDKTLTDMEKEEKKRSIQAPSKQHRKSQAVQKRLFAYRTQLNVETSRTIASKLSKRAEQEPLTLIIEDLSSLTKSNKLKDQKMSISTCSQSSNNKFIQRKLNKLNREVLPAYQFKQHLLEQTAYNPNLHITVVNPAYTSKTCSICGHINEEQELLHNANGETWFKCENDSCSHEELRDLNAAKNIKKFGVLPEKIKATISNGIEIKPLPSNSKKKRS